MKFDRASSNVPVSVFFLAYHVSPGTRFKEWDFYIYNGKKETRGVTTLRRAVSGEKQNSFGNLEILPGIGRLEKFSGRDEIMSGHGTQFLFC